MEKARVLTLEEVRKTVDELTPVFLEVRNSNSQVGAVSQGFTWCFATLAGAAGYRMINPAHQSFLNGFSYGVLWRCWDRRPTYYERTAEEWGTFPAAKGGEACVC